MPTLVIKSFPEDLHARLKELAAEHRRSVTQETIFLLETILNDEVTPALGRAPRGYWARRTLVPSLEKALAGGAFAGGEDSSRSISEEREER